jgi:hypothetical protein
VPPQPPLYQPRPPQECSGCGAGGSPTGGLEGSSPGGACGFGGSRRGASGRSGPGGGIGGGMTGSGGPPGGSGSDGVGQAPAVSRQNARRRRRMRRYFSPGSIRRSTPSRRM